MLTLSATLSSQSSIIPCSSTRQPKFDVNPKEGSNERIIWYLFDSFTNNRLPEYVYDDLALATDERRFYNI